MSIIKSLPGHKLILTEGLTLSSPSIVCSLVILLMLFIHLASTLQVSMHVENKKEGKSCYNVITCKVTTIKCPAPGHLSQKLLSENNLCLDFLKGIFLPQMRPDRLKELRGESQLIFRVLF